MTVDAAESSIPEHAEEVLVRTDEYGNREFDCVVNAERVGVRVRDANGVLTYECGDKNGVRHGVERDRESDGSLTFETFWVEGKEHGTAKQWWEGKLIGTYEMSHGTGVDLWREHDGMLGEERHFVDGCRHGFERWWGDANTIWQEGHFKQGVEHGIFREWNSQGRLRRGYPKYYVDGKQVSKRQYLKASASDRSLPPLREEDNRPQRDLPEEYVTEIAL